eukprot:COSAG02_NODE_3531_length_6606_cov_67.718611_7_plen_74_part_00
MHLSRSLVCVCIPRRFERMLSSLSVTMQSAHNGMYSNSAGHSSDAIWEVYGKLTSCYAETHLAYVFVPAPLLT